MAPATYFKLYVSEQVMLHSRLGNWKTTTLGDCSIWYSGGTPDTSVDAYWNGAIPWITASSLHRFHINDSERKITQLGLENGSRLMPGNSIIFVVRGMSLKTEFRVGITKRPVAFGQDCKAIVAKEGIDPLFLANVLRAKANDILGMVDEAGHGTGRLQTDTLKALRIPLPPLSEQRAIASILGALDDKIELNRRMNATLEATARAIFQSWFVDFDPVHAKAEGRETGLPAEIAALFPDGFVESELGAIPDGWKIKTVGELAAVVGGSTPSTKDPSYWTDGQHFWATPKDLSTLTTPVLTNTERKITDAGLAQISSGLLPVGTVLLSSRAPIGYLAINEIPVAINQGFIAMLPAENVPSVFLLYWAESAHDHIVSRANGSTFLEISKANFRPIPVITPDGLTLAAFGDMIGSIHERVVQNENQSNTLAALRDTLLPKLISGQLRVPEAADAVSAHLPNSLPMP